MNEIDKLYENAGIEKNCYPKMLKCHHCEHYKVINECTGRCLNEVYPPFTSEKQLKLIKLLCTEDDDFFSIIAIDYGCWKISYHREDCILENIRGRSDLNFENALANLINNLWQYLTDKEKEQIKEILK